MDKIIEFSVKNKLIIGALVVLLIAWGGFALSRIPIDAVPDITNNQVQVITIAPSLGAQEVEQYITLPLEIAFANLPKHEHIRSISRSGLSVVTIVFEEETDVYVARQLVSEQINKAKENIPTQFGTPELAPISTGLGEIYQYVLQIEPGFESKYNQSDLRTIQDWTVKRQLSGIKGVIEVSSFGGDVKQYEVAINPLQMQALDVTVAEISKALQVNNQNIGSSYIEHNKEALFIRTEGKVNDLHDIENIVIKVIEGVPIRIQDVAEVRYGRATRYGAMTKNGVGEVTGGVVLMLKGANSEQVIRGVEARVAQIQKNLPPGITIVPFINRADLINRAIATVKYNLVEGGLIVIFVLVLILGNLRAGILVASVIPLSLLFAFGMMHVFGVSVNLMSLGAIDFGLVVDGAVIIVEAVMLQLTFVQNKGNTSEIEQNVLQAAQKIRSSASFGEIIILLVYLPILTLVGVEGKMFKPMAQTVGFAIIGALILSFTYVPMMCSLVLKPEKEGHVNISEKVVYKIYLAFFPLLKFCFRWRWLTLGVVALSFAGSLYLLTRLGGEFLPTLEEGSFAVEARINTGSSLTEMIKTTTHAEKILTGFPEVVQVVSRIGSPEIPTDPMPMENGDIMIYLKDKSEWTTASSTVLLADTMQKALRAVPGLQTTFLQPIQMRTNELISGVRSDVGIKIFGDDLDLLLSKANEVANMVSKIEGVVETKVEPIDAVSQLRVTLDKTKIAKYGLTIDQINQVILASFAGEKTGIVYEKEKRFDLVLRLHPAFVHEVGSIKNLTVKTPLGQKVLLGDLISIEKTLAPMQISHDQGKRRVSITFNVRNRDIESAVNEAQQLINSTLLLPAGYYVTFGGQFENLIAAKQRLMVAVPLALFIILILLYLTFRSVIQALMVFIAIPLSAIGGVVALWWRDMPFSISAGVGFIALFGVAVLNGIVLIGYANQLRADGWDDITSRVLEAVKIRFRPVLLTALVASLGFLPMAISHGAGAEVQRPLATVVIGGLITSTLLTLIVLPLLYTMVHGRYPATNNLN